MSPYPPDEPQVNDAGRAAADDQLTERLAQAEIVISGVASAPVHFEQPSTSGHGPISQHDPDWWQSTIKVETVEKGKVATKTMVVLFANSADIAWHLSPKIKAGDHGIWLLQSKDVFGKPVPGPAVVHPLDYQPIAQLEHIRALQKSAGK